MTRKRIPTSQRSLQMMSVIESYKMDVMHSIRIKDSDKFSKKLLPAVKKTVWIFNLIANACKRAFLPKYRNIFKYVKNWGSPRTDLFFLWIGSAHTRNLQCLYVSCPSVFKQFQCRSCGCCLTYNVLPATNPWNCNAAADTASGHKVETSTIIPSNTNPSRGLPQLLMKSFGISL